jgi:hypothetical protein
MYRRCLFCQADLGANDVIEAFPVGRRLAYDAEKGRLWVVCPRCAQWNLTPLDARWEAIEDAERLYRATKLRVATDNVGLARLRDGAELVRIGRPLRPELAAWRYGDQFGRRRRRALTAGGVGGAALVAGSVLLPAGALVALALPTALLASVGATQALGRGAHFNHRWIADGTGAHVLISRNELPFARLAAGPDGGWQLRFPYLRRADAPTSRLGDLLKLPAASEASLSGRPAIEAARLLLPLVNGSGARASRVLGAVGLLEELGGAEHAFSRAAARVREWGARQTFGDTGALLFLPEEVRLALEMAAHEEQERRALEGELAALERAWRDAEAIAAIADELALPDGIRGRLARLRGAR